MSINVLNRKLLWGRSGTRCAFPDCFQDLTVDLGTEESELLHKVGAIMGEEAHIRSSKTDGPRHDANYDSKKLDTYENLMLLCPTHHTLIDKDSGSGYTVDALVAMKKKHEAAVTEKLGPERESSRAVSERTVALLSVWEEKLAIDDWKNISAELNNPIPRLSDLRYSRLISAGQWMLSMRWPSQYPQLARALKNLDQILTDLLGHLNQCMASKNEFFWEMHMEYKKIGRWDPPAYKLLFAEFQVYRNLIYALTAEFTMAINWVISVASSEVDEFFRFDSGVTLMGAGDGFIHQYVIRLEYGEDDVNEKSPYPGFASIREYVQSKIHENAHYFDSHHAGYVGDRVRRERDSIN